jgi:inorganic pyrophosphatase
MRKAERNGISFRQGGGMYQRISAVAPCSGAEPRGGAGVLSGHLKVLNMAILSKLPPHDEEGNLQVVAETPRGSRNKYKYDPKHACFTLSHILPEGLAFPFDFGFVPSTKAEDGDPLDVLILSDAPFINGCVIGVRLIGAIAARQKEKKKKWTRNDRLLAVPLETHLHADVKNLKDLPPKLMKEIKAFFTDYNALRGRIFEPLEDLGPKQAAKLIDASRKAFRKSG